MQTLLSNKLLRWIILVLCAGVCSQSAEAQITSQAARVFPGNTAAFISIPNVTKAKEAFLESSFGRMVSDPQLRPFITDFWGGMVKAAEEFEKESGVSLASVLTLPEGELALGLVSSETQPWVVLFFVDAGSNVEILQKLVDFVVQAAGKNGAKVSSEDWEGVAFRVVESPDPSAPRLGFAVVNSFLVGGLVIQAGESMDVVKEAVRRARDGQVGAGGLAEERKFKEFLANIRYANQGFVHSLVYVDPIQILRGFGRLNPGAAVTLAILPVLGLDGLKSGGAAASFNVSGWDEIREAHLFLDNPRRGVLDVPALKTGDGTPEFFVPETVMLYMTLYIDLPTTMQRVAKLYDGFRGEGAFDRQVGRWVQRRLGLDLYEELLPATAGRLTLLQWLERPIRVNSQVTVGVLEIKDAETAARIADIIYETNKNNMEKKEFGKYVYYQSTRQRPQSLPEGFRVPTPCFAAIDRYLVATDSAVCLQELFATADSPQQALSESLEYKLVRGRIKSLAGKESPAMFYFDRPEVGIELWYEGFLGDNSFLRRAFSEQESNNPIARGFAQALQNNQLPPLDVLKRYFAPRGGLLIDDATGLHLIFFGLRKKLP